MLSNADVFSLVSKLFDYVSFVFFYQMFIDCFNSLADVYCVPTLYILIFSIYLLLNNPHTHSQTHTAHKLFDGYQFVDKTNVSNQNDKFYEMTATVIIIVITFSMCPWALVKLVSFNATMHLDKKKFIDLFFSFLFVFFLLSFSFYV